MKWIIFYTIIALALAFAGYFKDPLYYIGTIIVGACVFYWIMKE